MTALEKKQKQLEEIQDINFKKNIKKILQFTQGPQSKAQEFSEMKIEVIAQCSDFVKHCSLPEKTNPREQLKWLRMYLKELREKKAREDLKNLKDSVPSLSLQSSDPA